MRNRSSNEDGLGALSRRGILKTGLAAAVGSLGVSASGFASANPDEQSTNVRFFGADRKNTGVYSNGITPADAPSTVWTAETTESVRARPAVVDETVYVSSEGETLYAIDRAEGTIEWTYESGFSRIEKHISGTPAVLDGTVYAAYGYSNLDDDISEGEVVAVDADSGEVLWVVGFDDAYFATSPVPSGEYVYVGSTSSGLFALDADSGDTVWSFDDEDATGTGILQTVPTVVDDDLIVAMSTSLCRLDGSDGSIMWEWELGGTLRSTPAVVGERVYVGSHSTETVYAFDIADGQKVWEYAADGAVTCSPSVSNDVVVVGDRGNTVHGIDAESGDAIWTFEVNEDPEAVDWVTAKPSIVDEIVYVTPWDSRLYALDLDTGEEVWSIELESTSRAGPVVASDGIYVGATNTVSLLSADTEPGSAVTGTVTNSDDDPLTNLELVFVDDDTDEIEATTNTDEDGNYSVNLEAKQTYEIAIEEPGFKPFNSEVTVEADDIKTVDIELTPDGDERAVADYTDEDSVVDTDGLRDAIDDWRGGEGDTDLLRDVIDYWRSADPVE